MKLGTLLSTLALVVTSSIWINPAHPETSSILPLPSTPPVVLTLETTANEVPAGKAVYLRLRVENRGATAVRLLRLRTGWNVDTATQHSNTLKFIVEQDSNIPHTTSK